jgi:hypothetical protein
MARAAVSQGAAKTMQMSRKARRLLRRQNGGNGVASAIYHVPIYWNVIFNDQNAQARDYDKANVQTWINRLNQFYARANVQFYLASNQVGAANVGSTDPFTQTNLFRGDYKGVSRLYFSTYHGAGGDGKVLGWSSLPWSVHPALNNDAANSISDDGVNVAWDTFPETAVAGGRWVGKYDQGKTMMHEIGVGNNSLSPLNEPQLN